MDTLSPAAGSVCFSVGARKKATIQPGSTGGCIGARGDLYGASLQIKSDLQAPESRGVISSSPELHMSSLKCSRCDVTPLCVVHSILFAAQTLSFELPIKRRPKIIPQIGAVDLDQGEDLEIPFSSLPTPLFDVKGAFLLRSREPVWPPLTWKSR